MQPGELTVDRFAAALVDNLSSFCELQSSGCTWVGKRGDRTSHLASACPCVHVACPCCQREMPRRELAAHLRECESSAADCPWGCGTLRIPAANLQEHQASCLMDPRKLLSTISYLTSENARLAAENTTLTARAGDLCCFSAESPSVPGWSPFTSPDAAPAVAAVATPQKRRRAAAGPGVDRDCASSPLEN